MIAGPPRQLIISHLLRSLGFGAQWLLPLGYRDSLYPQEIYAKFNIEKSSKERKEKTKQDFMFTVTVQKSKPFTQQLTADVFGEKILSNTTFSIPFASETARKFLDNGVKLDLHEALVNVATEAKIKHWTTKRLLFEEFSLSEDDLAGVEEQQDGTLLFSHGMTPDLKVALERRYFNLLSEVKHNGRPVTAFKPNSAFKENAFKKSIPKLTPNVNQTTIPEHGRATPAYTLFNILCLDYLENVDGNYVLSQMFNFGGPLSSQLNSQAHELINELYFDLRPAPDFQRRSKDGLGHDIDGAIPMVPAVVLREKPFTIYKRPESRLGEVDQSNVITTGGVEVGGKWSDQLYLKMMNQRGFRRFSGKEFNKVRDFVKPLGLDVQKVATVVKTQTKGRGGISKKKNPDGSTIVGKKIDTALAAGAPNFIDPEKVALKGKEPLDVAERPYSLLFSLPRPVFASPDGGRVTIESKVSSQETILGVLNNEKVKGKDQIRVKFKVIGTQDSERGISIDRFSSKNLDHFGGDGGPAADFLALGPNSTAKELEEEIKNAPKESWHVLEFMTIRSADIVEESYYRGDQEITNILELFGDINPDFEFQKAIVADKLPVITPISIQRSGVRVASNITSFIQHLLIGGPASHAWNAALGYRWVTMLDLWSQHNHELLSGSLTIKGMPGIRVGYRIDRPELRLSFYVESVGHEWTYPGSMITKLTVTRGQPANWGDQISILDYIPHEPRKHSNIQKRVALGRLFPVNSGATPEGIGTRKIRSVPGSVIGQPEDFNKLNG